MDSPQFQSNYLAQKRALTKAKKEGPKAVLAAVEVAMASFEKHGYPDQWHDWERAKDDALFAYQRHATHIR